MGFITAALQASAMAAILQLQMVSILCTLNRANLAVTVEVEGSNTTANMTMGHYTVVGR